VQPADNVTLALYRASRAVPASQFQHLVFDQMHSLIPFDHAYWTRAGMKDGQIQLFGVHAYPEPLSPALAHAWTVYQDRDVLGRLAFLAQGQTINAVAAEMVQDPDMLEHLVRRFSLDYALTTCLVDPVTGLVNSISLFRGAAGPRFTEEERQLTEALTPHAVESYALARLLQLMELRAPSGPFVYAAAASDQEGLLHHATREFVAHLLAEWPQWRGPMLPSSLIARMAQTARGRVRGARIVIHFDSAGESKWLRARERQPIDSLTPREAQVARLTAAGRSNKEVAQALKLSPHTVRNQLLTIYKKLGIETRAQLVPLIESTPG